MCAETACLALRLRGPLQSWEWASQFKRRSTGLMPTKSAVAGLCCAAAGADRGSEREARILAALAEMPMLAISMNARVSRLRDYHTVQGTVSADGKQKKSEAVLTERFYVQDGDFLVLLKGEKAFLEEVGSALQNPVWGLWLGRKACIPSAPVFGGLFATEEEALAAWRPGTLEDFPHERECAVFEEGGEHRADVALNFRFGGRRFGVRRIRHPLSPEECR